MFLCFIYDSCFGFATEEFFEVDYRFGQQDLVNFAKYAKEKIIQFHHSVWTENIHCYITMTKLLDYNTNSKVNVKRVAEDLKKEDNVVILKIRKCILLKETFHIKL